MHDSSLLTAPLGVEVVPLVGREVTRAPDLVELPLAVTELPRELLTLEHEGVGGANMAMPRAACARVEPEENVDLVTCIVDAEHPKVEPFEPRELAPRDVTVIEFLGGAVVLFIVGAFLLLFIKELACGLQITFAFAGTLNPA